jgi:hypothetical protein
VIHTRREEVRESPGGSQRQEVYLKKFVLDRLKDISNSLRNRPALLSMPGGEFDTGKSGFF